MRDTASAVMHLCELGRRYDAAMRIATGLPTLVVAALSVQTAPSPRTAYVLLSIATLWSCVYIYAMRRQPGRWVTAADAFLLAALAASIPWIMTLSRLEQGESWLMPFLSFACVGYQYSVGWRLGALAASLVLGSAVAATVRALPRQASYDSLITAVWSLAVAALARMLWTLMLRGARIADIAAADAELAQAEQATEAAVRAAKREHNRTLHDTAATTLLWVGLGAHTIPTALLAEQARRDLDKLLSFEDAETGESDLVPQLQRIIELTAIKVDFSHPVSVPLPRRIAMALTGATSEALSNIVHHADVSHCRVAVDTCDDTVRISITDQGRGFDTGHVPASRHGVRKSILQRITDVGGQAEVSSRPGQGTTIRLEWRR
ncbi:sensor histidine kinase [Streptomyces longwoodensis]|uniref:sensor histidine kinase n=1 Tax=Streptomyces longwoodensis TaxID=68231 RepID=UPI0033CFF3B7